MSALDDAPTINPRTRAEWRAWLQANHDTQPAVWLVNYKKSSGVPRVSWAEAVEEALCFGWIDGRARPIDDEKYMQFFCRRKPGGTWSRINKASIARLTEAGLMAPAGFAAVAAAKRDGSWTILDEVEELIIPPDLEAALRAHAGATTYFEGLSRSNKRILLHWLMTAKRAETRQKRLTAIATAAAAGQRPKGF